MRLFSADDEEFDLEDFTPTFAMSRRPCLDESSFEFIAISAVADGRYSGEVEFSLWNPESRPIFRSDIEEEFEPLAESIIDIYDRWAA